MTTALPGGGLDIVKVPLHGVEINFAGKATYTQSLEVTFLETADWSTRDKFVKWRESIRSWKNNSGSQAAAYKIPAQLAVYNDIPDVVRTINIYGVWPSLIGEITMDGSQSDAVKLQITFTYDWWEDSI